MSRRISFYVKILGDDMDTLIYSDKDYKKMIEAFVNVSVIGVLALCQGLSPIRAEKIAQVTAPDFDIGVVKERILNEISPEAREKNFNTMIAQKYSNAVIKDVRNIVQDGRSE